MIFAVESDAANPTEGAMVLAKKGSYDARYLLFEQHISECDV